MELINTDINDAVEECDKLRKELEGVGLSDGLVKCIELAYSLGAASVTDEKQVTSVGNKQESKTSHRSTQFDLDRRGC